MFDRVRSHAKRQIKGLVRTAGYELRQRAGRTRLVAAGRPTAGLMFEMIGPSGVGKSTLLDAALDRLSGSYFLSEDLHRSARGHAVADEAAAHRWLYERRFQNVSRDSLEMPAKIMRFNYNSELLLHDLVVAHGSLERGVFLEEGVCHCFRDEINAMPQELFGAFIRRRFLVHLTARDEERIAKQILAREEKTGVIRPQHLHKTITQLAQSAATSADNFKILSDRATASEAKVLTLYTDDGLTVNVERLREFEAEILAQDDNAAHRARTA